MVSVLFDPVDLIIDDLINNKTFSSKNLKSLTKSQFESLLHSLSDSYYNKQPIIDDSTYDTIESIYETLYSKNTKIGAKPIKNKVKLPYPMFSLDKLKDDNSINNWKKKWKSQCVVTDKLDGVSICYIYDNGIESLLKRGDEGEGTDVSYLLKYMKIPKQSSNIALRGELVISTKVFQEKYSETFRNTRNMVSGLTNSKTINENAIGDISLVTYQIYSSPPIPQLDQLKLLKDKGFEIPQITILNIDDLSSENLSNEIKLRKRRSFYDMDGIVITVNESIEFPTDSNPKHSFAFKIQGDTAVTTVTTVVWNASKQRIWKPLVFIEPVQLCGVTVSKATGFNARFIVNNGIGPGSKITITRGGDVIPHILDVLEKAKVVYPPENQYEWNDNNVEFILTDDSENSQVDIKRIVAFFKELNADFLAETTITKIYENGYNTLEHFLNLSIEDLSELEGFKFKSSERIVNSIQSAISNVPLHKLMAASSIFPNFGAKRLKIITDNITDIFTYVISEKHSELEQKIIELGGFNKLAKIFVNNLPEFKKFMDSHPQIVVIVEKPESKLDCPSVLQIFNDNTFVFTGCRPSKILEREIEKLGGRITSAVSKKTTMVVIKEHTEKDTTKVKEARNAGIPIILFDEFIKKYNLPN